MKRILAIVALTVAALPLAFGQTTQSQSSQTSGNQTSQSATAGQRSGDAEREILKLYDELNTAMGRGDKAVVDRILADGCFWVNTRGSITDRSQLIASLENRAPGGASGQGPIGRDEVKVWIYGDSAVVSARVKWKADDGIVENRNTRMWVRRDGRWQLAAQHVTRISPDQPAQQPTEKKP